MKALRLQKATRCISKLYLYYKLYNLCVDVWACVHMGTCIEGVSVIGLYSMCLFIRIIKFRNLNNVIITFCLRIYERSNIIITRIIRISMNKRILRSKILSTMNVTYNNYRYKLCSNQRLKNGFIYYCSGYLYNLFLSTVIYNSLKWL